jgi:hypothetical protein
VPENLKEQYKIDLVEYFAKQRKILALKEDDRQLCEIHLKISEYAKKANIAINIPNNCKMEHLDQSCFHSEKNQIWFKDQDHRDNYY